MNTSLILYSALAKSLCTYKRCWKWYPRAPIQAWARLILFANTFCRSACEMFLMNAVTAVFNSLSVRGRSRYTADFAAPHRCKCTATFRTHCICNTVPRKMYNIKVYFSFLKQSERATKTKNTQIRITNTPVQFRNGHNTTAPLETWQSAKTLLLRNKKQLIEMNDIRECMQQILLL
jgi:hypothetical protein